jgi:hypothetical protein
MLSALGLDFLQRSCGGLARRLPDDYIGLVWWTARAPLWALDAIELPRGVSLCLRDPGCSYRGGSNL